MSGGSQIPTGLPEEQGPRARMVSSPLPSLRPEMVGLNLEFTDASGATVIRSYVSIDEAERIGMVLIQHAGIQRCRQMSQSLKSAEIRSVDTSGQPAMEGP